MRQAEGEFPKMLTEHLRNRIKAGGIVIVMRAFRKGESCQIEGCEGLVCIEPGDTDADVVRQLDKISHAVLREIREGEGV